MQRAAIKANRFDTAISLLEEDVTGGRKTVRRLVSKILTPDLSARNATSTHEALLTLSKNGHERTRLITTNFDRVFEDVIESQKRVVGRYQAPLLPVPKNRWDGLVYLHGLLAAKPDQSNLDSLVLSSGDFGLAYLNERWAARFVSDLFRNYTVCFVGYSIDDAVLRYMMDALAADRLLGEPSPDMFAFGSCSKGKEDQTDEEWRAKNVTPILYRMYNYHWYLHRTLRVWAETYRNGVLGKEHIVAQCARTRPMASTKHDDFVGRLLWAMSDPSGLPAKRFAELDPVPSLEWLEPLSENGFRHEDLSRFGVPPKAAVDTKMEFSLTCRPAPYDLAPWMVLVDTMARNSGWDEVMYRIAQWLLRHLDDPALLLWMVKRGGRLHGALWREIAHKIDSLEKLEEAGNKAELEQIRANAAKSIPRPQMRTLWRLLLTGRVRFEADGMDLHRWRVRFSRSGLTATLRLDLREKLTPRVRLQNPFPKLSDDEEEGEAPERIGDLVEANIVLSTNYVHATLHELDDDERWRSALPKLLPDFSALLRDALDLIRELESAGDRSDLSYIWQPSISEHAQNEKLRDWTALIDLTRNAWVETAAQAPEQARLAATAWLQLPYPVFRRLAFFAAAHTDIVPASMGVTWLLEDDQWWLWSVETTRETMRLLVALAPELDERGFRNLEVAILTGPPRAMYRKDIEPDLWNRIREREIWVRLAKLVQGGATLSGAGDERLGELSSRYPDWELAADERDEFPHWTSHGWGPSEFSATPRRRRKLVEWLKEDRASDDWQGDDWQQRCRDDFPTTACALCALAREEIWPEARWRDALYAWSEEKLRMRSWRYMAPALINAPEKTLQALTHAVSLWLRSIAATFEGQEDEFLTLCRRVLAQVEDDDDVVHEATEHAINHPVGHVAEALLGWWNRRELEDDQGLPEEIKPIFTELCDTQIRRFRAGRTLLAGQSITLFRVDPQWTRGHVVPLFDWNRSNDEAGAAWEGFLWAPRLYRPLMEVLKAPFLDASQHYAALGPLGHQYASVLTFAALDPSNVFTAGELARATRALPQEGLNEAAETLARSLESAGVRRAEYWKNRVTRYLRTIWPKTSDKATISIAENLARVCVAAQDAFPEALGLLEPWLQPLPHPGIVMLRFEKSEICEQFPREALKFLHLIGGEQTQWPLDELRDCLNAIRTADPGIEDDTRFVRLLTCLRQRGRDLN